MNKRVKFLAVIIALVCVITACSKQEKEDGLTVTSQATSQEMSDVNSDDAVIEIPMPDDFYPFVPDSRTVYPVQDFDSDTDNQPYNVQGNTNENRLNDEYDAEYQYGTVARQGAYTYYIHNGAIFRMKDDEQKGVPILSTYQPEAGSDIFNKRIYGLSVCGKLGLLY